MCRPERGSLLRLKSKAGLLFWLSSGTWGVFTADSELIFHRYVSFESFESELSKPLNIVSIRIHRQLSNLYFCTPQKKRY